MLNDMRSAKIEHLTPVLRGNSIEEIKSFLTKETVPSYRDDERWWKSFRKNGILEWYNPPHCDSQFVNVGSIEQWIEQAIADYDTKVMSLPAAE